jgi:hypothetical protein
VREGRVIYMKFNDSDKVPEKEDLKKFLKKYGLVTKIFRKKEGKSYYIEFSSESSAKDLISDYQSGSISSHYLLDLIELDYTFNKSGDKAGHLIQDDKISSIQEVKETKTEQTSSTHIEKLDPNKHWQVY